MTFSSLVNIFPLRGCSYVLLNLKVYKIVRGLMAYNSIGCSDSGSLWSDSDDRAAVKGEWEK
ncbi:unnamed protein product [Prunus brigantina]